MEVANTTITVMRGLAYNDAGDPSDVGVPICSAIPAALVETGKTTYDRTDQTRRTIRTTTCRVPSWADITTDDTIRDERTGTYYNVEDIETQPTLGLPDPDRILTLRSVSGIAAAAADSVQGQQQGTE